MWTLQDAKNKFSAVVDAALAGTPQEVTRRGKPAVVVLSAEAYARLTADAVTSRGSFADHLLAFPGLEPAGAAATRAEAPRTQVHPRDVRF